MPWFVYELPPIDFGWSNLKTVEVTAGEIARAEFSDLAATRNLSAQGFEGVGASEFLDTWKSAQSAASANGWDGDFRQRPVVFWIPSETDFTYGFVIKQDNNGTTYVVSPVVLPHLADLS